MANPNSATPLPLSLDIGRQLVRLAEKAAAAAVLGSVALVVRHGVQASASSAAVRRVPFDYG